MQTPQFRLIALIVLLFGGNLLLGIQTLVPGAGAPRWPVEDVVYTVPGWSMSPIKTEESYGRMFISREYNRPDLGSAVFTIGTSAEAKRIYWSGAEVPLLGAGYEVTAAPTALVPLMPDIDASIAARGPARFIVFHVEGERRGFAGDQLTRWLPVIADGLLQQRNNYYKLTLMARLIPETEKLLAPELAALARTVFMHVGAWYAF